MRKHLLLAAVTFLFSFIASAQITKGSVLLGGNLSGFTSQYETSNSAYNTKQTGFSVAPSLGIATKENVVWGVHLNYGHSWYSSEAPAAGENKGSNYGGGVYHRRYLTLGKGFYLFGQANAGFSRNQYTVSILTDEVRESKGWSAGFSAYPGITYAVNKRIHLEVGINELISLGYSQQEEITTSQNQKNSRTQNNLSFGTNLSSANPLSVGFRFVLGS